MSTQPDPALPTDPHTTLLNAACLDFLLIELVPLAHRLAADLAAREEAWTSVGAKGTSALRQEDFVAGSRERGAGEGDGVGRGGGSAVGERGGGGSVGTGRDGTDGGVGRTGEEEEVREAVFRRLEGLGYRVGLGVVERFSRDRPRFNDTLDVIKFLCKDVWILVFRKQIDNLKTNHRGIYVLTDNTFSPLKRMSLERGRGTEEQMARAQPFLYFPAGLIRGALASLGITATVQGETAALPGATFQIRTAGARA